ncbi:hypothetical protein MPH_00283 [Macrophomina phaseolina MS6]|uniref:Uncharacterized protein n=1 Tax=Macrophomina phaseolina (strain MS6) TaxID=1126212 RepID=K2RII4_MACPH|nr:hypothetical protein MPH_00283 [Macrophomina phaseolina MS6]
MRTRPETAERIISSFSFCSPSVPLALGCQVCKHMPSSDNKQHEALNFHFKLLRKGGTASLHLAETIDVQGALHEVAATEIDRCITMAESRINQGVFWELTDLAFTCDEAIQNSAERVDPVGCSASVQNFEGELRFWPPDMHRATVSCSTKPAPRRSYVRKSFLPRMNYRPWQKEGSPKESMMQVRSPQSSKVLISSEVRYNLC